jgi:hypothetical protein
VGDISTTSTTHRWPFSGPCALGVAAASGGPGCCGSLGARRGHGSGGQSAAWRAVLRERTCWHVHVAALLPYRNARVPCHLQKPRHALTGSEGRWEVAAHGRSPACVSLAPNLPQSARPDRHVSSNDQCAVLAPPALRRFAACQHRPNARSCVCTSATIPTRAGRESSGPRGAYRGALAGAFKTGWRSRGTQRSNVLDHASRRLKRRRPSSLQPKWWFVSAESMLGA